MGSSERRLSGNVSGVEATSLSARDEEREM
jgi:hypothetical protein